MATVALIVHIYQNIKREAMSLYITLNKDINPQQLLQKIQNQINEHRKSNNLENSVLCIDIKNISHVVENIARETIAKLESK